jgi:branched-chain amino acid transport system substrate-binding protein
VLKPAGFEKSVGLISTTYLKDQTDDQWKNDPAIKEWEAFMKKYYPDGDLLSSFPLYGYTVAQTLHQVLKQAGNDLTRANIMKQAAAMKGYRAETMLPGIRINTDAGDFAPIESVQLIRFDGQQWKRFGQIMGK